MSQFEQLKLYYDRLFNITQEIKVLLEASNYDESITKTKLKDRIFAEYSLIKRYLKLTDEQKKEVNEWENNLKILEKENITFLEKGMCEVSEELRLLHQKDKITSKYETQEGNQGNLVDVTDM